MFRIVSYYLFCFLPALGLGREAYAWNDAVPDTVQIYLSQTVCPGETYLNALWVKDTIVEVFSPGANGAEDTLARIKIDVLPAPEFQLLGDSSLCNNDTTRLTVGGFFQSYQWSTGDQNNAIEVTQPGAYGVTVTDNNGCPGVRQVQVIASHPEAILESQDPGCFGVPDGIIRISGFTGGIAPYELSLNGGAFVSDPVFEGFGAGDYTIVLRDASGCVDSFFVSLMDPPSFDLDIGPDIMLFPGDSQRLTAMASAQVSQYSWAPETLFDCAQCPSPLILQPATGLVVLTALDMSGCIAIDTLALHYQDSMLLYVPNVFAPSGSGENALLTVYPGPGSWQVSAFAVYDRWGNMVFQTHEPVQYPAILVWDGKGGGKQVLPGVYIWAATLQLSDGTKFYRTGNTTVLR